MNSGRPRRFARRDWWSFGRLISPTEEAVRPEIAVADARSIGGPYGNGPYRETPCEPNRKVVDSLAEIVAKLVSCPEATA